MSEKAVATRPTAAEVLETVERLQPSSRRTRLAPRPSVGSDGVYDAMFEAGLFAMVAPKAYGGIELHPVEALRVWEAVARLDSAAEWSLVMYQGVGCLAAWLPEEG